MRRLTYDHAGRLLREQTTLNVGTPACVEYAYDELGRQTSTLQGEGAEKLRTTRQYNIRGWLLEQQNDLFSMRLSYLKPKYSASDSGFTGNIMEWSWRQGTSAKNTYSFTYDDLSRLTGSMQYVNGTPSDRFVERDLTYDLNGNVLHLSRTSSGAPSDSFDYSYTGNRLTTLSGTASGGYTYDSNGNMTRDGVNDLHVTYNRLNLIEKVTRGSTTLSNYSYLSDGAKLSATDGAGDGLVYLGSLVYRKQGGTYTLESAGFGGGRIVAQTTSSGKIYTPNYYVTDHLGSVRVVFDSRGEVQERNDYYPYGLRWDDANSELSDNRYRYNGKEEQGFLNLPYTDYGARMRDPRYRPDWFGVDPLADKWDKVSPHAFCIGNPLLFFDPTGEDIYMMDEMGRMILALKTDDENDQIYAMIGDDIDLTSSVEVNKSFMEDSNEDWLPVKDKNTGAIHSFTQMNEYSTTDATDAMNFFEFASKHTNVEWGLVKTKSGNNFLYTSHQRIGLQGGERYFNSSDKVVTHVHNHKEKNEPSYLDMSSAAMFPETQFFLYLEDRYKMENHTKYIKYPKAKK